MKNQGVKNQEVAKIFNKIADLLEVKGEKQVFKIQAYKKAS